MKKNVLAAIIAAAAMASAFAGCNPDEAKPAPTEAATEKTEAAATETAENTAEAVTPTEESKYAVLDFNECAEEVLRLTPYVGTSLSEDADGNTVLYTNYQEGVNHNYGPSWFTVDGKDIYVNTDRKIQKYDENGFVYRVESANCLGNCACFANGNICTISGITDAQTGETSVSFDYSDYLEADCAIYSSNDKISFIHDEYNEEGDINYYCSDNSQWIVGDTICSRKYDADTKVCTIVFPNGGECIMPDGYNRLVGIDNEGNYYFQLNEPYENTQTNDEEWRASLVKVDSNGKFVSYVMMPFNISDEIVDMDCHFCILSDGTVYISAAMNDAYVIWKINM